MRFNRRNVLVLLVKWLCVSCEDRFIVRERADYGRWCGFRLRRRFYRGYRCLPLSLILGDRLARENDGLVSRRWTVVVISSRPRFGSRWTLMTSLRSIVIPLAASSSPTSAATKPAVTSTVVADSRRFRCSVFIRNALHVFMNRSSRVRFAGELAALGTASWYGRVRMAPCARQAMVLVAGLSV